MTSNTMGTGAFIILLSLLASVNGQQPLVDVEQGTVMGKTVSFQNDFLDIDENVDVFTGIPYAEPPIGARRFAAPAQKAPWDEDVVYDATYFRDICLQSSFETVFYEQSEDCLHLNVYAPNPKPSSVPVMVWIHGGAYSTGNAYEGHFSHYSGVPLASVGDVIIVTINYRLNVFGFLTTGDGASPGNFGLLDQLEALTWINKNIAAFGGDPNKITIFGESAGAGSVSAHLFSPLSRDLFHQGIMESGSLFAPWSFTYDLEAKSKEALQIGEDLGCETIDTEELIECMRKADAEEISEAARMYEMVPCVDGSFFPESPMTMLAKGDYKKCPLIDGFNRDEGASFVLYDREGNDPNSTTPPFVSKEWYERNAQYYLQYLPMTLNDLIVDSINQEYVDWTKADDPKADYFKSAALLIGDSFFSCPGILETRAHALAAEFDTYQYFFTHVPSVSSFSIGEIGPKWYGAAHTEEIPFVFGWPFNPPQQLDTYTYPDEEKALSLQMIKFWTNFAKTGNPNMESMTSPPYDDERAWPVFTIPELQYKELAVEPSTSGEGLKADECHFWNDFLVQLSTFTANLTETEREWREEFYTWKYTDMEEWRQAFEEYQEITN